MLTRAKDGDRGAHTRPDATAVVDVELLDRAVAGLNAIHRTGRMRLELELAGFVVDHFFEGDLAAALSGRTTHATFCALDARADLLVGVHNLRIALRVADQLPLLHEASHEGLTYSHHVALLPVVMPLKRTLAHMAWVEGWSVRRLRTEIREREEPGARRRGRPRSSELSKSLSKLEKALEAARRSVLDGASRSERKQARAQLMKLHRESLALAEELDALDHPVRVLGFHRD